MANPRQAGREVNEAAKETERKVAEEASRAAPTAAELGIGTAGAGAEMLQRSTETAHRAWESSSNMTGQLIDQTMRQFSRAFDIGGQGAQEAMQQSRRNMESLAQSGTVFAAGVQRISRELVELTRKRLEQNLQRADAFMSCRTPQDLIAAQTDLMRENLEHFVQSTRRIAELSMQMADEAARRLGDTRAPH
jgi:phasin family protein